MPLLPSAITRALLCAVFAFPTDDLDAAAPASAIDRIPVLAWGGPPPAQTTPERYRELAEAGFTHNFTGFSNAATMATALDVAHAAGLKQFLSLPELANEPEATVRRFKDHPALGGYYLRDEPGAGDFPMLSTWVKRIQAVDQEHPCYINLFPNYANSSQLGTASYEQYLERFVAEVPVPFISFDHYPVIGDQLRPEWFQNLEQVAKTAAAANKPFWAFALAVAHGPYPIPTVEELRLQVFSNLAYGAQAIQYFTYWTFKSSDWNFHEAPINVDGKRTPVYDRVKLVNEEIRTLSPVFLGARVLHVGHTGTLPAGTRAYAAQPPITAVKTESGGAVLSLIENQKRRFLVIVNRDFRAAMPLVVQLDGSAAVSEVGKNGSATCITAPEYSTRVAPGDIVVLSWNAHE